MDNLSPFLLVTLSDKTQTTLQLYDLCCLVKWLQFYQQIARCLRIFSLHFCFSPVNAGAGEVLIVFLENGVRALKDR